MELAKIVCLDYVIADNIWITVNDLSNNIKNVKDGTNECLKVHTL